MIFIDSLAQQGGSVARDAGLPVSIMLAQACYESGYGTNWKATGYNVLFGITKVGNFPDHPTIDSVSPVSADGSDKRKQPFCIADDYEGAVRIWVEYLLSHPIKSKSDAMRKASSDPSQVARLLPQIFAFGPANATVEQMMDYTQAIMDIVRRFGLLKYD